MAEVTNLSIEIAADANGAAESLKKTNEELQQTAKALRSASAAARRMGLDRVGKQIGDVAKQVSLMADLGSVQKGLGGVADKLDSLGAKGIAGSLRGIQNMPSAEKEKADMERYLKLVHEVGIADKRERAAREKEAENERKAIADQEARDKRDSLRRMAREAAASERAYTQIVQEEARKRQQIAATEARARERSAKIGEQSLKEATKAQIRSHEYDKKEAERAAAASEKQQKSALKSLSELSKRMDAPLKKIAGFFRAIGRIALYRAIRSAIKAISSAIKEGMTNLKAYSEQVGTAFAPAVDNLRRHVLWLKNAFATALRPVVEALIPVIQRLVDWLVKASDFIAQVLSVMTGKVDDNGRYTRAVLSDLEQSNKQAKELRRTLLGFDEINRLDGDTGSGESNNAGLMFEQADVSEKAVQTAAKLQEIIGKIRDFINGIDWEKVLTVILSLMALKKVIQIVAAVKKVWDFLKGIAAVLGGSGGILALITAIVLVFALWGDKIGDWIETAKDKVDGFFERIKENTSGGINHALIQLVGDAITLVMDFIASVARLIYKFTHGDFKGALDELVNILKIILKGIVGLILGAVNLVLGFIQDAINLILLGVRWIYNNAIVPFVNTIATIAMKIYTWVHNAFIDVRIAVLTVIKFILDKVNAALQEIIGWVNDVIASFNEMFGTELEPIEFEIDTEALDDKINELENKKLPPITEKVELLSEWKEPKTLNLQINTKDAYAAIDRLGQQVNRIGAALGSALRAADGDNSPRATMIQFYASGGFPAMGSLFVAGEAGAEYVGNFNGRTGVYNTDQMTNAMYNAMSAALANMPQSGGDIYLDGEIIYRNMVRRNNNQVRATGRTALLT